MYALFWGIKNSELRGRKFKIITDYKAPEEIRRKLNVKNKRINRRIKKIQEFDFQIEYKKGKLLVIPDALSRVSENEERT